MSTWSIAVYSVAALLGVRILLSLMVRHRGQHLARLQAADEAQQREEPSITEPKQVA